MAVDPTPQTHSKQLATRNGAALAATMQSLEQPEPVRFVKAISCTAWDQRRQAMGTEIAKHHKP
jgi:hypothetical protein